MKRVSFNVAKAIKDAGYSQDYKNAEDTYTNLNGGIWVKPTYLEVWLWLDRTKKILLEPIQNGCRIFMDDEVYDGKIIESGNFDLEEAIIASIEYLVDNDLIK